MSLSPSTLAIEAATGPESGTGRAIKPLVTGGHRRGLGYADRRILLGPQDAAQGQGVDITRPCQVLIDTGAEL